MRIFNNVIICSCKLFKIGRHIFLFSYHLGAWCENQYLYYSKRKATFISSVKFLALFRYHSLIYFNDKVYESSVIELYFEYLSVWCIDCVVLSCHIRVYSESTPISCLIEKELLARNYHLVQETLRHFARLAKWLSCVVNLYVRCSKSAFDIIKHIFYKVRSCGVQSHCSHLILRYRACF